MLNDAKCRNTKLFHVHFEAYNGTFPTLQTAGRTIVSAGRLNIQVS